MTEEERARLTEAKARVSAELLVLDIGRYRLGEVDPRLLAYVEEVAAHPEGHNLWEQLAVKRFFRLADKYGIDRVEVQRFFAFYEGLYFPGKEGYRRYELTPVQCFQFASVFAFWEGAAEPGQDGLRDSGATAPAASERRPPCSDGTWAASERRPPRRRVVRECVLYVPRKFSKTTGTASFAIYDLLLGESNGEIYIGANSQDQARKCFDVIRGSLRRIDTLGKRFVINKETVRPTRNNPRSSIAQCLTANARTKDGLNASTVIMDEFSQARDSELLNVLTTSMGVRENPLTVIITTASDVFEGPFYGMLRGYKEMLLGELGEAHTALEGVGAPSSEDDTVFAHLFEPDLDDPEDSEATWRKVHPHIGVTVSMEFYRQEYRKAKRNGAEAMLAFRTKLLNVYAENEQRSWISATLAKSISVGMDLDKIKGRPDAMVGIDLSESDDFSAVTFGFYIYERKGFDFHTSYFFPEGALAGHPNEHLYRAWAASGHLILTEGDVIDYRRIVEHIVRAARKVNIRGIGFDPYKSQECVNMLRSSGFAYVTQPVRQSYGNFTSPVESFEHGVKTDRIRINDNPINWYCFGNAVLDYDNLENCKPVKRKQSQKIDGVITMLMSYRLFIDSLR